MNTIIEDLTKEIRMKAEVITIVLSDNSEVYDVRIVGVTRKNVVVKDYITLSTSSLENAEKLIEQLEDLTIDFN